MPVDRFLQATFASGEFDPLLDSREDVAFYYSSAKRLENVIALPQGGAKRREGLRVLGIQRGLVSADIDMSGYAFTNPNGGTGANMISAVDTTTLLTTVGISTTTEYVIGGFDAGAAVRISMCDVICRLVGGTQTSATISIQSSDDDITYTTRASLVFGTTFHMRRFALAPNNDLGTHRYWRFIVDNPGAVDFSTDVAELYGVAIVQETGYSQSSAVPGDVLLRKITTSIAAEYWAVISDRNVDIWTAAGVWQAAVEIPHGDADITEIKTSQQRDTLVLYHEDHPPHIVQRLDDTDDRWRAGAFEFDTVAQFPFEDSTTGGQNEKQELSFSSMGVGDRLVFEFNGDVSAEVAWNGTAATNAANFETAIEGLEDITSASVSHVSGGEYLVEFDGADANRFFATLIVDILSGSGTVTLARTQYGRPNQEDLWSVTRGYPRCGTFYQGRHWMGGFRSRPDVIAGSRAGDLAQFKEDADPVATSPLVLSPDIDEQVTVENLYPGRNLQIFTSSAEMFIPDEPITPTNVSIKVSSKRGAQQRTQPVDVQGGTLFVDRNGTNLREFLFVEAEKSYTAEPVSTLGGHLVQQPTDMALRRSVDTDEPTILYIVNQGRDRDFAKVPAAAVTIDRAQQVTASGRMVTDGEFLTVAATQGGEAAFMVLRDLAGNEWNYLETLDADHMSDHSYEIANPDIDEATATAGQTVFSYTFTNPAEVIDIAMFQRADAGDVWRRIDAVDYTLDTGAKTITLDTGLAAGTLTAICKRATTIAGVSAFLEGVEVYVHADGRPVGLHTPSGGSITIAGDEGYWFETKVGLRMVPDIIMQAYKGQGGRSPTMQNARIFRALLNVDRTSHIAVSMESGTPRPVALTDYDGGTFDLDLEDVLFTGLKRVSGFGRWEKTPRLRITQTEPGPFVLRSAAYDIRF